VVTLIGPSPVCNWFRTLPTASPPYQREAEIGLLLRIPAFDIFPGLKGGEDVKSASVAVAGGRPRQRVISRVTGPVGDPE